MRCSVPAPFAVVLLLVLLAGSGFPDGVWAGSGPGGINRQDAAADLRLVAPRALQPGQSVLVRVEPVPSGAVVSGRIDGREVPFTADGQALLALDMDARPGSATFRVQVSRENRVVAELGQAITVGRRQYKEERLNLPEKKVELDPGDQARAARETAAIRDTFAVRGGRAGFVYGFRKPVEGRTGGLFGSRRILNGKPRSPHNGVDIAAPRGSAVVTTAPGTVVLVGHDFFFTGNTVIVHHGHGVLSLYAHLDQIEVAQGAWLDVGSRVGTLGMTGRATGPHLHWGAWVRGERVDPLMLPGVSGS